MTKPDLFWDPRSEDELRAAAVDGRLEETHYLDIKAVLPAGRSGNRSIACDIAAFSLDGGKILIGIDEDEDPPALRPVPLDGLAERIESVAHDAVNEPVLITTTVIPSSADPSAGYVVVHVPPSPRAPHMADGRYYGRGDKKNRILQNPEVQRLHRQRLAEIKDVLAGARQAINDLGNRKGRNSILLILAEPVTADEELLVPLSAAEDWKAQVRRLTDQPLKFQGFAPALANSLEVARRPSGVAVTTGMREGRRWEGESPYCAEIVFREDGRITLASERVVVTETFPQITPQPSAVDALFENLLLGHLELVVRSAAAVAQRFQYTGSWRIAVVITGLQGTKSWTVCLRNGGWGRHEAPTYTEATYEKAAEVAHLDLMKTPLGVVGRLVAPLMRSYGTYQPQEFAD